VPPFHRGCENSIGRYGTNPHSHEIIDIKGSSEKKALCIFQNRNARKGARDILYGPRAKLLPELEGSIDKKPAETNDEPAPFST
jgi:hypothetical protein